MRKIPHIFILTLACSQLCGCLALAAVFHSKYRTKHVSTLHWKTFENDCVEFVISKHPKPFRAYHYENWNPVEGAEKSWSGERPTYVVWHDFYKDRTTCRITVEEVCSTRYGNEKYTIFLVLSTEFHRTVMGMGPDHEAYSVFITREIDSKHDVLYGERFKYNSKSKVLHADLAKGNIDISRDGLIMNCHLTYPADNNTQDDLWRVQIALFR